MKFVFGDIVVVEGNLIGVVVKSWFSPQRKFYEVYVRCHNSIIEYNENEIERYLVRHKYLNQMEYEYQKEIVNT